MTATKPYPRTYRMFVDGTYSNGGEDRYVTHPKFAIDPIHHIRAFELIQKDVIELFDYIEPADSNEKCYSYRIHSLLLRLCIEFEDNVKAILYENGFEKRDKSGKLIRLNISDYKKIESTHFLSKFEVKLPFWSGIKGDRKPFLDWKNGHNSLTWYEAYNDIKHDRRQKFTQANFGNLIDAYCGLLVLLTSQFGLNDFIPRTSVLALAGSSDGFESPIGGYLRIKFPQSIPVNERYEFRWTDIQNDNEPFDKIDYLKMYKEKLITKSVDNNLLENDV